jgi:limonene-1,2-epoxide hydrolase
VPGVSNLTFANHNVIFRDDPGQVMTKAGNAREEAIHSAVDGFFSSITGLSHDLTRIVAEDDVVICEGEVAYTRHDASRITLPFINVFEFDGELISNYKIYMDVGPLYDP